MRRPGGGVGDGVGGVSGRSSSSSPRADTTTTAPPIGRAGHSVYSPANPAEITAHMTVDRRPTRPLAALAAGALLACSAFVAAPGGAHEFAAGELRILHPSAPPTPPGSGSAAGYLVIVNDGAEDERLLGGAAPFAEDVELHRTTVEDDVARMRRLDEGLEIPAGTTVRLDPGATHLMFTGLNAPLVDGERRSATLRFERAGEVPVEFAVERAAAGSDTAPAAPGAAGHEDMDHGQMDHGQMDHGEMDHGDTEHGATSD